MACGNNCGGCGKKSILDLTKEFADKILAVEGEPDQELSANDIGDILKMNMFIYNEMKKNVVLPDENKILLYAIALQSLTLVHYIDGGLEKMTDYLNYAHDSIIAEIEAGANQ